eukprot:COSAG02_NODE_322_length_24779_cov_14.118233_5_plen_79_part_00
MATAVLRLRRCLRPPPARVTVAAGRRVGALNLPRFLHPQVIKYFYYKLRYANEPMPPEFPIEPSMALELLMAANYLDA